MYFSKTASILGHFLSSEEWFSGDLLFRLYRLCVTQLMHLYSLDDALHSFILWFPVHRRHVSSPLQSRKRWLNGLHLKQRVATMQSYALHISQPIFILLSKRVFLTLDPTSMTRILFLFLDVQQNFGCRSPVFKWSSGFCEIIFSSAFSAFISSGMLCRAIRGFLSFCVLTSTSVPHLVVIVVLRSSISFWLPDSMSILPSRRDLKVLMPTFISVGFTLVLKSCFMASGDW